MIEDVRRGRQARMPWRASHRKQAESSPLDLAEWVGKNRQPGKVGRQSRQKEGRKKGGSNTSCSEQCKLPQGGMESRALRTR